MASPSWENRTTPPRARVPALIFLALVLVYLLAGYRVALADLGYANRPAAFGQRAAPWFWAAQFHMFNEPRPTVSIVQATVQTQQGVVPVDLPKLYPTLREEGPSYARNRFYQDAARVALLGQDICRRVGGSSVRIWLERQAKQTGVTLEQQELGNWPCTATP
jgi:hypothetical protein